MNLMDKIPSWDEAETLVATQAAKREDNMIKDQEETRPTGNDDENSLCNLKDRLERAMHRLSEEAWWPGHERNHSLESELLIFQDEVLAHMNAMPPHEAMRWLGAHLASIEYLHARTERERWHALRTLVGIRGNADYTADLLEDSTPPTPTPPTPTAPTEEDDEIPWDDDDDSLSSLESRAARAVYRLWDEAWWPNSDRNYSLEQELLTFKGTLEERLDDMPHADARQWLMENVGALQSLLARTESEREHALQKLIAIRGGLEYTADHIAAANAPTPTPPTPTAPTEEDDEIPWDDDDQDDEEFHAAATREIVEAYRATAMAQRDLLLARFRGACARLGGEAACTARGHPWGRGVNAQLGQLAGRVEFCMKGICPIDAAAWLESNVGELEELHARNKQEYDQAGLAIASLDDRLFGLIYDLARER
jgi:hypothetical protein